MLYVEYIDYDNIILVCNVCMIHYISYTVIL